MIHAVRMGRAVVIMDKDMPMRVRMAPSQRVNDDQGGACGHRRHGDQA